MKKEQPNFLEKMSAVIGDCSLPNLGIAEQYQEILKNEVNIVLHSAATVRFDEHLRIAVKINIHALQDLLKLSRHMKNLKSFIHISTAYSNCAGRKVVDEVFYKPPINGKQLTTIIDCLDDDYITNITPSILGEWPNTYAMTKAIAEGEVLIHGKNLPVGVVRPSMIVATDTEPVSGWINNFYGPTGVVAATGLGVMRCMRADPKAIADIVPGDYVSNAVLAAAWDTHNQWKEHNHSINQSNSLENDYFVSPIFNFVSSSSNPVTWDEFSTINKKYGYTIPSLKAIWPIILILAKNKYKYLFLCFFLHTIPGYFLDTLARLTGKTPKLMDGYRKLEKFADVISYFSLRSWIFHDKNTRGLLSRLSKQDQFLFQFNISQLNWDDYFYRHVCGIRMYILKDPLETISQGKKHIQRLNMAYYTLLSIFAALVMYIVYGLFLIFMKSN